MKLYEEELKLADLVERELEEAHQNVERIAEHNQWKVLQAFQKWKVSDFHFSGSTGYGYNDRGREVLDGLYAEVFGAESAIVRPHFVSGTHTISTALFGMLRPGDHLLFITGSPYDTLHKVIGIPNDGKGTLSDWGVEVETVALLEDGNVDWNQVEQKLKPTTKVAAIQRSRGYSWRPSFSVEEIGQMVQRIKSLAPDVNVFVDNCYGEFTERLEPTQVGVDLMAGSLIKNPGGGLAASGGYIAGKRHLVDQAANRLTAPGLGAEVGAMLGASRAIFQGLFLAPHMVGQAVKGVIFAAALFEKMGFITHPTYQDTRTDLIQAIQFQTKEQLIRFIQCIQEASPVDSYVRPEPWEMPGYTDSVIMAAGTFIQGGSLELSADAPIREPFIAYMQGGLTYEHVKMAVIHAMATLKSEQLL